MEVMEKAILQLHQKINQNTQQTVSSKFRWIAKSYFSFQYCLTHLIENSHMFRPRKKEDKNYVLRESGEYYQTNGWFIFFHVSSFHYCNSFKDLKLQYSKEKLF